MSLTQDLVAIAGAQNVFDDAELLALFSADESFTTPGMPWAVVKPKNVEEIRSIIQWANENMIPLIPVSSPGGPRFHGDTIPAQGGIVVDLSGMDKILNIDRQDRVAMVEPGVTFDQLDSELRKQGMRAFKPLLPRRTKSVLASGLEREPIVVPKEHWDTIDPLICTEIIFGTGDMHRTGSASGPGSIEEQLASGTKQINPIGPASVTISRLLQGAQGTLGILTWGTVTCGILPEKQKPMFITSDEIEPLTNLAYRLLRGRIGEELFLLNGTAMANIIGENPEQISKLGSKLPPWIMFVNLTALNYFPDEKIRYQEKMVMNISQTLGLDVRPAVEGFSGDAFMELLDRPSKTYYKMKYKGGCQDILFKAALNRVGDFIKEINDALEKAPYRAKDMGIYLQPVLQGCSCQCEFFFPFDPNDENETKSVEYLNSEGSKRLARSGAFFSRPYGVWSDIAYSADAETTGALRKVKQIFDPKGIMNPGKLCY